MHRLTISVPPTPTPFVPYPSNPDDLGGEQGSSIDDLGGEQDSNIVDLGVEQVPIIDGLGVEQVLNIGGKKNMVFGDYSFG